VYDEMFNLNVKGPYFAAQKLAPLMPRGSAIVLTTSAANVKGIPMLSAYGAAKAALRSLARSLAAELLPRGIRVNAISPGPIQTQIMDRAGVSKEQIDQFHKQIVEVNPMKRWGRPEEIAKAAAFLAFDATFTNGHELPVDGGMTQL
jgi:NAD(P)-dependent dehydrogenase (short-subunit alcohol dehydrogenase family)